MNDAGEVCFKLNLNDDLLGVTVSINSLHIALTEKITVTTDRILKRILN